MKTWKIALLVIAGLLVVGGGYALYHRATRPVSPERQIVAVERGTLAITVSAMGTLVMPSQARLTFGSSGTIAEVNVEMGDDVKAGQALARLDTTPLEQAVAQAEANLRNAQISLEKVQNLYTEADLALAEANVASAQAALDKAEEAWDIAKSLYDSSDTRRAEARAALLSAQASLLKAEEDLATIRAGGDPLDVELSQNQVATAQIALDQAIEQLEEATIVAPFDGVVANVASDVGDKVSASTIVLLLVDPTAIEVEAIIDELDIFQVELGQEVVITLDALPDTQLEGEVTAISPVATTQAGVVGYCISISVEPVIGEQLKGGLTALADIIIEQREDVLLVPNQAIKTIDSNQVVEVLISEEAEQRSVTVGLSDGRWTEIVDGLQEGEQVIIETTQRSTSGGFHPFGG